MALSIIDSLGNIMVVKNWLTVGFSSFLAFFLASSPDSDISEELPISGHTWPVKKASLHKHSGEPLYISHPTKFQAVDAILIYDPQAFSLQERLEGFGIYIACFRVFGVPEHFKNLKHLHLHFIQIITEPCRCLLTDKLCTTFIIFFFIHLTY